MKMVVKRERERATEWVSESWMNNRTQWGEKKCFKKNLFIKKVVLNFICEVHTRKIYAKHARMNCKSLDFSLLKECQKSGSYQTVDKLSDISF